MKILKKLKKINWKNWKMLHLQTPLRVLPSTTVTRRSAWSTRSSSNWETRAITASCCPSIRFFPQPLKLGTASERWRWPSQKSSSTGTALPHFAYWNQKVKNLTFNLRSLFPLKLVNSSVLFCPNGQLLHVQPKIVFSNLVLCVCVCASSNFTRQNKWRISCSNLRLWTETFAVADPDVWAVQLSGGVSGQWQALPYWRRRKLTTWSRVFLVA